MGEYKTVYKNVAVSENKKRKKKLIFPA